MVRFRAPRGTLLWVNKPEDLDLELLDGTLHLKKSEGSFWSLLGSLPFLIIGFAVIGGSFIYTAYEAYSQFANDSVCDTRYYEEVELGGGEIYCEDTQWNQINSIDSVEVADQHFKYVTNWGDGNYEVQEFRWSVKNEMLAIGLVESYEGERYYQCSLYKMESSLSQNWTADELTVSGDYWYALPSWCRDGDTSSSNPSYSPAVEPLFGGELLYVVVDAGSHDLHAEKYTENTLEYITIYAPYNAGIIELMFPLIFGLIFGGIFLAVGDNRGMVLTLNGSEQTMRTRKAFGGTRLSGWTWTGIDFSSLKLKQHTKTVKHSSGGGENGPVRTWTTRHKGIEFIVLDGRKPVEVLFLEHGDQLSMYDSTIERICESLGVEVPEMVRLLEERPAPDMSLEKVRLTHFPVREWDSNNDARVLVSWFNNESSRTNNYSLQDALETSGIQRLDSTEDAQHLLDHLVDLLKKEATDVEADELSGHDGIESNETTAEHDGDGQAQASNPFWNDS